MCPQLLTTAAPLSPLQMINAVTDIQEDTVVEVVISAQSLGEDDVEIRPHQLSIHSYKSPTFCHFCGEMLFGMFKQVRRGSRLDYLVRRRGGALSSSLNRVDRSIDAVVFLLIVLDELAVQ